MGELFIATPRCVCMLTQKVLLAERQVSAMWRSIPGVMRWNYIYHAISEELLATNEMEGVRSTRKETEAAVAAARQARTEGDMEKARFGEFAKLYLNLTNRDVELPKTLEDIRDIYDKIALDEIDDKNRPDGELFRKGDVEVQGPHGTVIHSGVSSEARISALLAQMMDLARSDTVPAAGDSQPLPVRIHPPVLRRQRQDRQVSARALPQQRSHSAHRAVPLQDDRGEQERILQGVH